MAERSYRILLWTLAVVGVVADQATKYGVFAWLSRVENHTFVVLRLAPEEGFQLHAEFLTGPDGQMVPHVNQGALFGFLNNHRGAANLGFAVISLLAAVAIVYWSRQKGVARDPWLCAALGLILAGTLGNLYDRLVFNGVRDFLHWNYLVNWPVFNVADCCLVLGAFLLLFQAFGTQTATGPTAARPVAAGGVSCAPEN